MLAIPLVPVIIPAAAALPDVPSGARARARDLLRLDASVAPMNLTPYGPDSGLWRAGADTIDDSIQ